MSHFSYGKVVSLSWWINFVGFPEEWSEIWYSFFLIHLNYLLLCFHALRMFLGETVTRRDSAICDSVFSYVNLFSLILCFTKYIQCRRLVPRGQKLNLFFKGCPCTYSISLLAYMNLHWNICDHLYMAIFSLESGNKIFCLYTSTFLETDQEWRSCEKVIIGQKYDVIGNSDRGTWFLLSCSHFQQFEYQSTRSDIFHKKINLGHFWWEITSKWNLHN